MSISKILVCVDFDHTLVDCNSDIEIKSLAAGKPMPEDIEALAKVPNGWPNYMCAVFKFLHQNGARKEDYVQCLSQMPMTTGFKDLLLRLYEIGDCEIIIISDSNSFFINCFLHHHQVNGVVSKVFTNSAEFDRDGCLSIRPFHHETGCGRCQANLCKGSVLTNYVAKRLSDGVQFLRTLYIGDGRNDVCPSLRLGQNDYIFARVGHPLLRSLEKMPAKNVKAVISPWETGYDIRSVILSP